MQNTDFIPDEEFITRLTSRITALIPRGSLLSSNPPVKMLRSYSFLLRYSYYPDGDVTRPMNLLVKIPRKPGMTTLYQAVCDDSLKVDALREYKVLRSLATALEGLHNPNFRSIDAIAYIEDTNAIVMEELELRLLEGFYGDKRIWLNSSKRWREFENYLGLAGELLRYFHEKLGDEKPAPLSRLGAWSLVEKEFSRLEKILGYRSSELRESFDVLYRRVEAVESPVATLHKDYHLGNIFLSGNGRIGMLDPNSQAKGSVYEDIARLVVDPLTRKIQILTLGGYFRPSLAKRFERAVLQGYFGAGQADERLLMFYSALLALTMWRVYEENMMSRKSTVLSIIHGLILWMYRRYFPNLVSVFLNRGLSYTTAVNK